MPPEQNGHSTAGDSQRPLPTPFLTKSYQLVDDPAIDDKRRRIYLRRLEPDRLRPRFASKILQTQQFLQLRSPAQYLRIQKIGPLSVGIFQRLLPERRKISTPTAASTMSPVTVAQIPFGKPIIYPSNSGEEQSPVISSTSSPSRIVQTAGIASELIEENEKLRKENAQLSKELAEMKSLYNSIYNLVSNFASSCPHYNKL